MPNPGILQRAINLAKFLKAVSSEDHRWIFSLGNSFGVLNGDIHRAKIVEAVAAAGCRTAIETGTYFGETTQWLARHFDRVITIEAHPKFASVAKFRIDSKPNVELLLGDSSAKFSEALNAVPGGFFAYLDAHWGTTLPLGAELRALERRTDFVCMIDDFEVADTEYGFDVYDGVRIGAALLRETAPWLKCIFVPAYPPSASGDLRRGYCVFGRGDSARPLEQNTASLGLRTIDL